MDPNANLREQAELLHAGDRYSRQMVSSLRRDLLGWLSRGGFAPDWKAYPAAAAAFKSWKRDYAKFSDLAR